MPSQKVRDLTDIRNGSDEVRTHNHHHEDGACCCGHHHHEHGDECGHEHHHEHHHSHHVPGHPEDCRCEICHPHEEYCDVCGESLENCTCRMPDAHCVKKVYILKNLAVPIAPLKWSTALKNCPELNMPISVTLPNSCAFRRLTTKLFCLQ